MADLHITRPPFCHNRKIQREPLAGQNSVRVYNYAPGLAMLQVRGKTSYQGMTLTAAHLHELCDMINAVIADMHERLPADQLTQIIKEA